jgi:glutamine amidotransferase
VGAFAACRAALDARPGLGEALDEAVRLRGRPFLGICVGMQLMASRGLEFGVTPGLGWIPGEVRRLQPTDPSAKVPHMGWNDLIDPHGPGLIAGIGGSPMYFTHSFAFWPDDKADVAAEADHGGRFPAAVVRGNMAGVQFHPEKSQSAGISLLSRFLEWRP